MITDEDLALWVTQCETTPQPILILARAEDEKRRNPRWRLFGVYGTVYWRGETYNVTVDDISMGGIRLRQAPLALERGNRVIVTVCFDDFGTLALNAIVAHGSVEQGHATVGLTFMEHDPEELNPLVAYLDAFSLSTE